MKILFVCENYFPHYGGVEVVFKNLAERFVQEGHEVNLVTHLIKGAKKKENIGGVQVHRISCFDSRYLFTFLSLPKILKLARQSDLIQTTSFNGAPPAWLAGKLLKKPVVITVHEFWGGKWKEVTGFSSLKSKIHELLEKLIYLLKYDQYVCVSNSTKEDLLRSKVDKKKVITIHNGFDYDFWKPENFNQEQKLKERFGLKDKFTIFSWGRPGASKGFEYLIDAFPLIKKKIPPATLLLMFGSVDKYKKRYAELSKLIEKSNTNQDIKIINSVPYEQLGNYIKTAEVIVIPSVAEGFGYAALEAIALGKKVVVSDAGSLPEVVSGKHQIFKSKNVYDLAEKVFLVFQGTFLEQEKEKFTWKKSVRGYLDLYKELIKLTIK